MPQSKTCTLAICLTIVVAASVVRGEAGSKAAPPIDITNATVTITNAVQGVGSCCVNVDEDKVNLSASGAVDTDQCKTGNQIDLSKTRWTMQSGTLSTTIGATTSWKATATGTTQVRAFFNDAYTTGDYNDDQDPVGVPVNVTGFKVGCLLTTNAGGSYTLWSAGDPSGNSTEHMSGTLTCNDSLNATGTKTDSIFATATWQCVVHPAATKMKGHIRISGQWNFSKRPSPDRKATSNGQIIACNMK